MKKYVCLLLSYLFVFPTHLIASDCPDGQEFRYNRCVKTTESLNKEAHMAACSSHEDPKQCIKDKALEEAGATNDARRNYDDRKIGAYTQNSSGLTAIQSTAALMGILGISAYVVMYWSKKKKSGLSCKSIDMTLLFSAAAAMLATEGIAYFNYQRDVKKAQTEFKEFQQMTEESEDYSEGGATQAYTLAGYNAIIKQEYAFKEATEIRKVGYSVAAGAFAAAATVSAIAMFKQKAAVANGESGQQYLCPNDNLDDVMKGTHNQGVASKSKDKSGGGMGPAGWMAIIVPVLGIAAPLLKKNSSIENPQFNMPTNLIENMKLHKKFYSMNQATTKSELDALKKERESLRSNKLSSPSLKEYMANSVDDAAYSEFFSEMKTAYLFGEAMDEKQEVFELLMNNQSMAGL